MVSHDILHGLIDGKGRGGHLSVDGCQKYSPISPGKEHELSSQTRTHKNVVLGSVGAKPEVNDRKHVFCGKLRDLLWLKHGGSLQFGETITIQFDQKPTHMWRVLKVVVDSVDLWRGKTGAIWR